MKRLSFAKQMGAATLGLLFVFTLFTSCHRGYGCPGHITKAEQPVTIEQDC